MSADAAINRKWDVVRLDRYVGRFPDEIVSFFDGPERSVEKVCWGISSFGEWRSSSS